MRLHYAQRARAAKGLSFILVICGLPDRVPDHMRRTTWPLDALLVLSLIALPLAWILDPFQLKLGPLSISISWGWKPVLVPALLLAARIGLRVQGIPGGFLSHPVLKKLVASWIVTWVFFISVEALLALAGVQREATSPIVIKGEQDVDTAPSASDSDVTNHPELIWSLTPGGRWDGMRINSLGFRDREVFAVKPGDTKRVIAMGDSCTAQGKPPYSQILHQFLQTAAPTPESWHAFNTGVYGYSSLQGLRQFQLYVRDMCPDVVTLYYGWNDHWLHTKPDHLRMAVRLNTAHATLMTGLQKLRLYGLLARLTSRSGMTESGQPGNIVSDKLMLRVAPEVYRATLETFVREIRDAGAVPILLTAPSRSLTSALVRSQSIRSVEEGNHLHSEYVAITREVAVSTGAHLLDLAAMMEAEEYDDLFTKDGIHFNQSGLEFIAQRIHEKLVELGAVGAL